MMTWRRRRCRDQLRPLAEAFRRRVLHLEPVVFLGVLADSYIVGVMPPRFSRIRLAQSSRTYVWVPNCHAGRGSAFEATCSGYNLRVIGRLRDNVSIERAQAQMDQIDRAALAAETPRWFYRSRREGRAAARAPHARRAQGGC